MAIYSDVLLTPVGGVMTAWQNVWVRLVNNDSLVAYVSDAATPSGPTSTGRFVFSTKPPGGSYTVYTGPTNTGAWTATGETGRVIGYGEGDHIVGSDFTANPVSPYAPNLPGASSVATPAGVSAGAMYPYGGLGFHVRAFNAKGDGVTDDRAAIVAAQAKGTVIFDIGNFACSDYVDIGPGTHWIGTGVPAQIGTTAGTVITASGTNKGVIRWRPGSIGNGNPVSGQTICNLEHICFNGSATTGHLVWLARITNFTSFSCYYNNTSGTGLKDDGVTSIAAAGVYLYGCELIRFFSGAFANNNSVVGNGGAGITMEKNTHMVQSYGTHYDGNTSAWRIVDIDCGSILMSGGQCIAGAQAIYSDVGGWYGITMETVWCEQQTATAGAIINSSGANANANLIVRGCSPLKSTAAQTAFLAPNLDGAEFACNFYQTWGTVYNLTGAGGFVEYGNHATGITATFATAAVQALFAAALSTGIVGFAGLVAVPGRKTSKVVVITYAASMNIDPALGDYFLITVTNTTAFTLTISAGNFIGGQRITLCLVNSSGGVMGVITWPGAFFRVATDWTNPANGKRRTVSWFSEPGGSNYVQDGPASGDM